MRIVVIGGTRFIGPRVVRRLVAAGHRVTVCHRGQHQAAHPAGVDEIRHADLAMPVRRIPEEVRRVAPDIVLHMIAMGEADALAAVRAFAGVARRIVAASSGDVYRAYGVFTGIETGAPESAPLSEDAPLRTVRHPYRRPDTPPEALEFYYEKIVAEEALRSDARLSATILRLPKVYGPEENADLATVYGFRQHPHWRWTHGHVENVAAALALAVLDDRAAGRTYNVGEAETPTIGERLTALPARPDAPLFEQPANFAQDIAYDTTRIRAELGYREAIDESAAMREQVKEFLSGGGLRTPSHS
jgi:nucleoside-diphosphate-sugar epimerase